MGVYPRISDKYANFTLKHMVSKYKHKYTQNNLFSLTHFTPEFFCDKIITTRKTCRPMFSFGFGAIFVVTQLPGLPCLEEKHLSIRLIPLIAFIIIYVLVYVAVEKWTKPYVVLFIPMAEYFGAIGINVFMVIVLRIARMNDYLLKSDKCAGKRRLIGLLLFFACILLTIVCSIIAQFMDLAGDTGGPLMVYIPMCILIPLSLFAMNFAMKSPSSANDDLGT